MAILSTNHPPSAELEALAKFFSDIADELQTYLCSDAGQRDPNRTPLTTLAIELNNASDRIEVMELALAVDMAQQAIGAINQAVAELQHAMAVRHEVTRDLGIVQDLAALAAAIVAKDPGSIVSSGADLYNKLHAMLAPSDPS